MEFNNFSDLFPDGKRTRPDKFTMYMGEKIRSAREESGYSQEELAKKIYLRRPTLSDIENGKVEVDASTLELLSYYLRKPLTYFFPIPIYEKLVQEDMDELSLEMQMHFEQIHGDELKKLAINIIKMFAKFDPKELVISMTPHIAARLEREKELEVARQKKI